MRVFLLVVLFRLDASVGLTPASARLAGVKARGGSRSPRRHVRPKNVTAAAAGSFRAAEGDALAPDVIGCLDFECTCAAGDWDYVHEIIEFPVVLLDARTREITDSFHRYVRPTENATLTEFCTELTGIDQATVDGAETLDAVLEELDAWLRARGLVGGDRSFAVATDGWDLHHFLDAECARKGLAKPDAYLDRWVDVSKAFALRRLATDKRNGRKKGRNPRRANLPTMLRHHKLALEGRLHSGADDARNIARVAVALLDTFPDWPLRVNDALPGTAVS